MKRTLLLVVGALILVFGQSEAQKWETQRAPMLSEPDPDVAFSAVDANVCWGLKETNDFTSRQSPQILRTTNGGSAWDSVSVPGRAAGLEGSSIAAIDANTAWVVMWDRSNATSGGVFTTTNAGAAWRRDTTVFSAAGARARRIHFFDAKNGVVLGEPQGGNWEIYTTTDGGAQWVRVPSENIPVPQSGDGVVDFSASVGKSLWFGTGQRSVYRTSDRGMTWSVTRNVLGADGVAVWMAFRDELHGLACSPFSNSGGNRIHRTTDGGATWTSLAPGSIPAAPSANWLGYDPVSHVYVLTSGHGNDVPNKTIQGSAYSPDDGLTWIPIDALPHGQAAFAASGAGWSDGANDSVYKWVPVIPTAGLQLWLRADAGVDSLNGTVSRWHDQSGNGNDVIQTDASRRPLLLADALNHKPIIRFDGVKQKLGFTGTTRMSQFSLFLVVNNHANNPITGENDGHVLNFGAARDFDHQWFMGMNPGGRDTLGTAIGWESYINATLPGLAAYDQWRNLSIIVNQRVWNTTVQWDGRNARMWPGGNDAPVLVPMGDATGSGGGIGATDGVPVGTLLAKCDVAEVIVYSVALSDSARRGVSNYLANKYGLSLNAIGEATGRIAERFELEQNYPNPFNPSTTIRYAVPKQMHVTLTVYNILGQKVANLVSGDVSAGDHEVQFNAGDLASGIYFYRLQAGGYAETRSLCVVR